MFDSEGNQISLNEYMKQREEQKALQEQQRKALSNYSFDEIGLMMRGATPEEAKASTQRWRDLEEQYKVQQEENYRRAQLAPWERGLEDLYKASQEKDWDLNTEELLKANHSYNQRHVRDLLHDINKIDSAEQHVIDIFKEQTSPDKNKLFTINEAREYAKEKGVEWNAKDKETISKAALDIYINHEIRRKEMEQELIEYQQDHDYTRLNRLGQWFSSMSGSVGAAELAAYAALSWAGGAGISGLVSRVGGAAMVAEAGTISRGVQLAAKAEEYGKAMNALKTATKEARIISSGVTIRNPIRAQQAINATQNLIKNENFLAKLGYDSYRYMRTAMPGTVTPGAAGSVTTTAIPFAIDSMITDIPRELIEDYYKKTFTDETYTIKNMLHDQFFAAALGGSLPFIGKGLQMGSKGLKTAGVASWDITENAINKVRNQIEDTKAEAALKNDALAQQSIKEIEKNTLNNLSDIKNYLLQMDANTAKEMSIMETSNLTPEETIELIIKHIDRVTIDGAGDVRGINSRPAFMSTAPNVYNELIMAERTGKSIDEAWENVLLHNEIKREKTKVNTKHDLSVEAEVQEIFDNMKYTWYDAKVSIKGDTGYLGKPVAGLTQRDADYVLKNLYIARIIPDTRLGKEAAQNLVRHFYHIEEVTAHIKHILDTYNTIVNINKISDPLVKKQEAKNFLKSVGLKYQKNKYGSGITYDLSKRAYPLKDGTRGSIYDAIKEVMYDLMPEHIREKIALYKEYKQAEKETTSLIGHPSRNNSQNFLSPEDIKLIEAIEEKVATYLQGPDSIFVTEVQRDYGANGIYYFENLLPFEFGKSVETGGAKATRSARLEYIGELLEEINTKNIELFQAEDAFQKQVATPEELAKMRQVYVTSEAERIGNSHITALDFSKKARDNTARYNVLKATEEELKNKIAAHENVDKVLQKLFSVLLSAENNKAVLSGYAFTHLFENLRMGLDISQINFNTMVTSLQKKMEASDIFKSILESTDKAKALKDYEIIKEFKKLVFEVYDEDININKQVSNLIGEKNVHKMLNSTVDAFSDYLSKQGKEKLDDLVTPHIYNPETSTKEEIAKEIIAKDARTQIFNSLFEPFVNELANEVMQKQIVNYNRYSNLIDFIDRIMADPGHADEAVIGSLTMTPVELKGISFNVENLSCHSEEEIAFKIRLEQSDQTLIKDGTIPQQLARSKEFMPLTKIAYNEDEFPRIQEALANTIRFTEGYMDKTEEEVFKRQNNSRYYRIAKAYLDTIANMKQDLYNLGSDKTKLVNFWDPFKIKKPGSSLRQDKLNGDFANRIRQTIAFSKRLENDKYKYVEKYLNALLTPAKDKSEFIGETNALLHFFETLDLNSQFKSKHDLNAVRDAILDPRQGLEYLIKVKKWSHKKLGSALKEITENFLGIPGEELSFMQKLSGDMNLIKDENKAAYQARYLKDIEPKFYFKSPEVEKENIQIFGFDNMKSMLDNNFGNAKKAYAVLSLLGPEPIEQVQLMMDLTTAYANNIVPKTHGLEKAHKLQKKLNDTWKRSVMFNAHNVCGTYTIPANKMMRWAQLVIRFLTSPMLSKAGIKSFSDYNYQFQHMVNMGLAREGDLQARWRVGSQAARIFTSDKDIAQQLFMSSLLKADTMYQIAYNTSMATAERGIATGKRSASFMEAIPAMFKSGNRLSKYASNLEKAEQGVRSWTDFLLNKMFWIEPLTNYNRENAALTVMKSIAGFSNVRYDQMPSRLQDTLFRFGVNKYEWDNILSKYGVKNAKDYIYEVSGKTTKADMTDYKMFFPQLMDMIPEEDLERMMKEQGMAVTDISKQKYRKHLKDKMSVLINSSADEMTSIPTSRIQGFLSGNNPINSVPSFVLNSALQFQSFGAAINYYQMGRRLAAMSTGDSTFNHILGELTGHPSTAMTLTQFIAESALVEFFIAEIVAALAGNSRKVINDQGEVQGEAISDKVWDSIGAATGLGNNILQSIISGLTTMSGKGGGFTIPLLPAVDTALQKGKRVVNAFTKETVKNERGKAVIGAVAEDFFDLAGIPQQVFAKQIWGILIGDTFREWQYGDRYQAIQKQRAHRGYTVPFVRQMAIDMGWLSPNESSFFSRLVD